MEVIESVRAMQDRAAALHSEGQTIALVPTMGYLHEGHLELMRIARRHAGKVVVSIFVNPTQFGPNEDFERYPRDTEGDLAKTAGVGVDLVFLPPVAEMYPEGFESRVQVLGLTQRLCGRSRPTHFDGVATVVCKLFNITRPHLAVFGQKDFQQLTVIGRMVADLNMDVELIGAPIVREPDGLAMSSRNKYLSAEERSSALCLKESLDLARRMLSAGETKAAALRDAAAALIESHPLTRIDYVSLSDPANFEEVEEVRGAALMALAVFVGRTRLIDNAILEAPA